MQMPIEPINMTEIIWGVVGGLVLVIPVAGLTARFALRPIVDAIARFKEAGTSGEALRMIERRMDLLEQEVQSVAAMRDDIARLVEAQEFQLRLAAPREGAADPVVASRS
jgi:hypothetical protein